MVSSAGGSSVCPPIGQRLTAQREWSERAAILLRWPQSPSSSQSIPLSCPLSFCQLLSAPQSAFQCTSFGKIEVAIQSLTFPHSLFSPPLNSFLTQWAGVRDTTRCIPAWLVAQQAIEQEISLSFRKGWEELNSDPEWREEEDLSQSLDNAAFSRILISTVQWARFSSYQKSITSTTSIFLPFSHDECWLGSWQSTSYRPLSPFSVFKLKSSTFCCK